MEVPVIVDGRNLLDSEVASASGLEYVDMDRHGLADRVGYEGRKRIVIEKNGFDHLTGWEENGRNSPDAKFASA